MDQLGDVLGDKRGVENQQSLEDIVSVLDTLVVALVDRLLSDLKHGDDQILESLDVLLVIGGDVLGNLGKTSQSGDSDLVGLRVVQGASEQLEDGSSVGLDRVIDSVKNGEEDVDSGLSVGGGG